MAEPRPFLGDSLTVSELRTELDRVVLTSTDSNGLDGIGSTIDGTIVQWQGGVRGEAMIIRNVENLPRVERPPAPRLPILALSATRCVQTDPETSGAWVALIPSQGSVLPAALPRIDLQCSRDVLAAAIAPTGRFVVGGTRTGRVRVWSTRDGRLLHEFEGGHGDMVTCVAVQIAPPRLRAAGVGFVAATGAFDGSTRVWHIPCGGAATDAAAGNRSPFAAGVELFFRQGDGFTRGDPRSGYEREHQDIRAAELAANEDGTPLRFPVTQVALNCDGSLVAVAYSLDRSPRWRQAVRVWSTVDGSTAQPPTLFGHGPSNKLSDVRCLAFHPTRRTVLATEEGFIGRTVDVAGSEGWAKRFYRGVVSAMCWSADGRDLMTATWSSPGPVELEVQRLADPDGTCHDSARVRGSAW